MNNTLRYGFMILEFLAERGTDCSTSDLAREMGLSKSQVSRVLKTLTEIGYVSQNSENRQYGINLSVLKLSHSYLAKMRQRHVIRPYMQELVDKFDQGSYSSVPVGLEAIVCDVIYPRNHSSSAMVMSQVGAVNNPYMTASGKICAAYLSEDQINDLLERRPLAEHPSRFANREAMLEEYARIKQFRVAYSEMAKGDHDNSIAAPVFDCNEKLRATIGLAMPGGNLDKATWDDYQNAIVRAANGASFALGYPLQ